MRLIRCGTLMLIAGALVACEGKSQEDQAGSAATTSSNEATATRAPAPSPDQIIAARRPEEEQKVVAANNLRMADIDSPNDITRSEIKAARGDAFEKLLTGRIDFHNRSGRVKKIEAFDDSASIAISLDDNITFNDLVKKGTPLYEIIKGISDNGLPVLISGTIVNDGSDGEACHNSTTMKYPTPPINGRDEFLLLDIPDYDCWVSFTTIEPIS